ncbi:RtcB family protein [Planctomycetota bacterium]|nr:RtcB family protein [Planctomycetota bacterium]
MTNSEKYSPKLISTGDATAILPLPNKKYEPIRVIGTPNIRSTFDNACLRQAVNARMAPGVTDLVLNPDAHIGYGAPVGCVMASPTHIYPGPVGVDIKCSMSLLQFDLPADQIEDKKVRRALINAICERVPTGAGKGQRSVPKSRSVDVAMGEMAVCDGASEGVLSMLDIPEHWRHRCEDASHVGHDGTTEALVDRMHQLFGSTRKDEFASKIRQLGSYGGGNHFGECEVVQVAEDQKHVADVFGLKDGHVAFLSHCGSRGLGHNLAADQFRTMQDKFDQWAIPFPANDKHLCYAPLGSPEANDYLDDMAIGANFATVNHMLINALVLEAFRDVFPSINGELIYFISHNIARKEVLPDSQKVAWVMRKGATRAFPAGHYALKDTPFVDTGHPILLPGDPQRGSAVMVALEGAKNSLYSVNHGAGRMMGRRNALRTLDQKKVNESFDRKDIMTNCRNYPRDEAPAAYKDLNEVLTSVKLAGLAAEVARLKARFVIKDADKADD